jgi:TPR repeat protein
MRRTVLAVLFLLFANAAQAYVLTPPECRFGRLIPCVKAGQLEYIVIYNTIQYSDYAEIRDIADNLPKGKPFPTVYLHSLGGSLDAAYGIGKIFHRHNVTVKSGNPITGDRYSKCISACVIIAAGATKRYLYHIGLHSPANYDENDNTTDLEEEGYTELEKYLADMGMDPRLFMLIRATKYEDLLQLEYNPNQPGKDQYLVQLGFYQDEIIDEYRDEPSPVKYTHYIYGRASIVLAAMNGSRGAVRQLADEYTYGGEKVQPDIERAKVWLNFGADQDDISSLHNLGVQLVREKNNKAAVPYFRRAAKLGFAGSQNNYGWHLYKGEGVKQNKAEAVYWIVRGAEQGEPFAYGSLCEIYGAADVFIKDDVEAMKWCRLAADNMPLGKARDTALNFMDRFARKMNDQQIAEANKRVDVWHPLRQTATTLRDKDDNSKVRKKYYF